MIEYLSEIGCQRYYEECVGTRKSFEGKNVVSLTQIHKLMSQTWFKKYINIDVLITIHIYQILIKMHIKYRIINFLPLKNKI